MAVNLGIGQRNTKSGIQGNRKPAQIPTGPSRTVGVANDPGVAGGPSSIPAGAFGPDGNVEAGRQIQAGANTIIADEVRDSAQRQAALNKSLADEQDGHEKNVISEGLIGAKADYEQIRREADLDTDEGKKDFFKKFGEVNKKWLPIMVGANRQEEYESDLRVLQTEQSIEGSKEIYGAGVRVNKERANAAADIIINENPNVDPRNIWGELFNGVSKAAGNLSGSQITAIAETKMREVITNRITNISSRIQPTGRERDEVLSLVEDPFVQHFMGAEFAGKTAEAITRIAKDVSENSKEARAEAVAAKKRQAFFTDLKEQTKGVKDEETLFAIRQDVYMAHGFEPPKRVTLNPGEGSFRPGAEKPDSKVPFKKESITFKSDELPGSFNPNDNSVSTFETPQFPKAPIKNDSFMDNLAEDGTNIVSNKGARVMEEIVRNSVPSEINPLTNVPLARTDKATAFISRVVEDALDSARRDKTRSIPLRDHANAAAARVPAKDRPSTYNFQQHGFDLWTDNENVILDRPVRKGFEHPETQEGANALRDELLAETSSMQDRINAMKAKMIEEGFTEKQITDATGWFSGLNDTIAKTVGNIFSSAIDPDTQQARFQFSLLARDFIRLVTLSPRFAVKEQQLLEKIFSGSSVFLSPGVAAQNIKQFLNLINLRGPQIIEELGRPLDKPGDNTRRNKLMRELELLKDIQNRAEQFVPDIGGAFTDKQIRDMSQEDYDNLTDQQHFAGFGVHRKGSKGEAEEGVIDTTPKPQTAPEPQPAPEPQEGDLQGKINAALTGGLPEWKKLTVADMLEALAVLDLSNINQDMIRGELSSLGVAVPDNLSKKSPKPKKSKKGKK
jgi:hypothetical protein